MRIVLAFSSFLTASAMTMMSDYDRSALPSRPVPLLSTTTTTTTTTTTSTTNAPPHRLDAARLLGLIRVGATVVSPTGTTAIVQTSQYDFAMKKANPQLWFLDLALAATMTESDLAQHRHLRLLTDGKQHDWSTISAPHYSPCGNYVAFVSNRKEKDKSSVWTLPLTGPGDASLLAEFPISIEELEWTEQGGIVVSASVYVDQTAIDELNNSNKTKNLMTITAERDQILADKDGTGLGGLNAVLYQKLPIRDWDHWLTAKMAHPFYVPVTVERETNHVACNVAFTTDLLEGVPTAVPSGAFGGSEDWSISIQGHVAVSARPPLAPDEAWTTNRHIYLKKNYLSTDRNNNKDSSAAAASAGDDGLGVCLTRDNPGYDTTPTFSPNGQRLAWLSMAGPTYESDAIGIKVYDVETGITTTLLEAETDFDYSPYDLTWSKDGKRLYFTTDRRSRRVLCSIDSTTGAADTVKKGGGITIHTIESSLALHGEISTDDDDDDDDDENRRQFLTTVQSLTMPSEIFLTTTSTKDAIKDSDSATTQRQLTFFNTKTIAETALGVPEEIIYKGAKDEDVQAWLIRPAGLTQEGEKEEEESNSSDTKKYPLAVIYHGGPQGSTGDDWHYRWNLQYYASMGFAVLAPNFHGSTGFGHQFCRDISGNWEIGGIDTIAGVKAVLEKHSSWIDPDRVVGLGASYGGYTSNWLNGNAPKNMFQALVCHCGTFDLRSSYYATEELFFMETEFGGPAYTDKSLKGDSPYQKYTPSAKVHEWKTPTLVIHGAKDFRLVESEGISTFTALQRQNVPSQLLYLPTENHHCLNYQNSMVWHETVLSWIEKWTTTKTAPTSDEKDGACDSN